MADLTEGFDDPAIGKATIIVAPPPGGFKGALDGLNRKEFPFMPQMLGRAWRKGNKPRLRLRNGHWCFTEESFRRIVSVCDKREQAIYGKFMIELNKANRHV